MTFAQYWQDTISRGTPDTPAAHALAQEAWDAALCAVQAEITGPSGRLPASQEIAATLSRHHTWAAPIPSDH